MIDHVDSRTRSRIMASVGGKHTCPEMALRRYLHSRGFGFRLHRKDLPGTPDLVLPKYCLAIFVHGCYWNHHPGCAYAGMPKSNVAFWSAKFERNVERDRQQRREMIDADWRTLIIWQCGLRFCQDRLGELETAICGEAESDEWPSVPPKRR